VSDAPASSSSEAASGSELPAAANISGVTPSLFRSTISAPSRIAARICAGVPEAHSSGNGTTAADAEEIKNGRKHTISKHFRMLNFIQLPPPEHMCIENMIPPKKESFYSTRLRY